MCIGVWLDRRQSASSIVNRCTRRWQSELSYIERCVGFQLNVESVDVRGQYHSHSGTELTCNSSFCDVIRAYMYVHVREERQSDSIISCSGES